jgi:hypothetical protein
LGNGLVNGFGAVVDYLLLAVLVLKVFALVDAAIRPAAAYLAAGKLTKVAWLLFLGIAAVYDFKWGAIFSILTILGCVAAIVYLVDVRPALRQLAPPRGGANRRDRVQSGDRWRR